jgi:hypothetical protein
MSIDKLKTVYSTGAFINNVKVFFKKINEIIDYLNGNPIPTANYKIYRALLTQTGTSAPVANVLENTLGNIVWSRESAGNYYGTLNNAFPIDKTIAPGYPGFSWQGYSTITIVGPSVQDYVAYYYFVRNSENDVYFEFRAPAGNLIEWSNSLYETSLLVEIIVYN